MIYPLCFDLTQFGAGHLLTPLCWSFYSFFLEGTRLFLEIGFRLMGGKLIVETNIMLHAADEELRQNTTSPTGIFLWIQNIYNTKDNCTAISMFTDIRALKTIFGAKSSVSEYQMSETIPITDQLVCPRPGYDQ